MRGTLSISGELSDLARIAKRLESWLPKGVETEVRPHGWGGWTVDSMAQLLERVHPFQLLLLNYISEADGVRPDADVRRNFTLGDSGLRGQTGAISKHIVKMTKSGIVPADASYVLKVDRQTSAVRFVMPDELVSIVQSALALPHIAKRVEDARESENWTEK